MITPAFNLTATERVLPRLALDFTTAVLDPRITFTRAGDTATVTNLNGSISLVNANTPRFDYKNGLIQGLLIEETRTNSVLNSLLSGATTGSPGTAPTSWSASNSGTEAGITAIELASYADGSKLTVTTVDGRSVFFQSQSVSANTSYTYSLDCEIVSGPSLIVQFFTIVNTPVGATVVYFVDNIERSSSYSLAVGVYKLSAVLTVGANAGSPQIRFGVGVSFTATGAAKFSNVQFEAGAFPTSYIPTTTTAVTRNADVATMTGTNFSDWYTVNAGTFFINTNARNGNVLLTAGIYTLTANATALKKYATTYTSDQSATMLDFGLGTIKKVNYYKQALTANELSSLVA